MLHEAVSDAKRMITLTGPERIFNSQMQVTQFGL